MSADGCGRGRDISMVLLTIKRLGKQSCLSSRCLCFSAFGSRTFGPEGGSIFGHHREERRAWRPLWTILCARSGSRQAPFAFRKRRLGIQTLGTNQYSSSPSSVGIPQPGRTVIPSLSSLSLKLSTTFTSVSCLGAIEVMQGMSLSKSIRSPLSFGVVQP